MKIYYLLISAFLILLPSQLFSQKDTINQLDQYEQKFGYWKHFYDNGNIESEGRYMMLNKRMSPEHLFMVGITSTKTGEWKYFNNKGQLIKIEYWDSGKFKWADELIYEKGKVINKVRHKSKGFDYSHVKQMKNEIKESFNWIEVSPTFYNVKGKPGETETLFLRLFSHFDKEIPIQYETNSENIKFLEKFNLIRPNQKLDIPFSLKFPEGRNESIITFMYFHNDSIKKRINIFYQAYDLSDIEFKLTKDKLESFTITKKEIYIYRKTEECELKIYPYYKNDDFDKIKNYKIKETAIYPLSLEFNEIDISHLPKDRYLFRIVNYRDKIDRFAIVNLE